MPMVSRELQAERAKAVAELTRRGVTAPQIAATLGVHTRTVERYRNITGVHSGKRPVRYSEEELRRVDELLNDGCSIAEAARTIGRPEGGNLYRHPLTRGRGWSPGQASEYRGMLKRLEAMV